jgi:transposase InsO family protein
VIDLYSRRLLAAAFGQALTAELCSRALQVGVTARGGRDAVAGVVFHTDRGATYTATAFTSLCRRHSSAAMMTPIEFEKAHHDPADLNPEAA